MKSFWIGGKNSVLSALLNKKREVNKIIIAREFNELKNYKLQDKVIQVNKSYFSKIFKENDFQHQFIAANINEQKKKDLKKEINNFNKIIILDNVTDPRNIGSIIRTAVAFNFQALIVQKKHFNSVSPQMFKTASGAIEKIAIFEEVNLSQSIAMLKKNNFWINALDTKSTKLIDLENNWSDKNAFVFGSENKGISKLVKQKCDNIYKINISANVESLNVSNAVAATLSIFNFKTNISI